MTTLACTVSSTGITAPDYADILAELQNAYYSIYGADSDLDADSQDGQFIAILAQAIYDTNQIAIAVYNAYSPATSQGTALSSVVKINGIERQSASNSTDVVTLMGVAGTVITGGQVGDNLSQGTIWNLPPSVTIPDSGTIDETVTCAEQGDIQFAPGSLTVILTPTRNWQSVTNIGPNSPGNPIESDATLRQRQAQSTALPSLSIIEGIYGAVAAISGVSELQIYENQTDITDGNGIPPHSIAVVVLGGDIQTIADTIALKKTPGTNTYGDISVLTVDQNGVPLTINFTELEQVPLFVTVTLNPLSGYTSLIGEEIQTAVASFINSLLSGEDSYLARLYSPANLGGTGDGATFVVTGIVQGTVSGDQAAADIDATYEQQFTCTTDNVTITVL
jgi:uncharacterized phage protein gp47/JayE